MRQIPDELKGRPFTHREAAQLGVPAHVLTGRRFTRVHPRVWRWSEHELTDEQRVTAARLALPADARLTGITRIQAAGLDHGPRLPIRFVVARDLHLDLDGIFLHRTKLMPPTDAVGVIPAAAFVAYCSLARVVDAIGVGDWLLRQQLMTLPALGSFVTEAPWRAGAHEAGWLLQFLDGRARSLPESTVRSLLVFAGMPRPEINAKLQLTCGDVVHADLLYRKQGVAIEYEGSRHQLERGQYVYDLDRYAEFRRSGVAYIQVTREAMRRPQRVVRAVHALLLERGYDGPTPHFAERWPQLWRGVTAAAGPRPEPFPWER